MVDGHEGEPGPFALARCDGETEQSPRGHGEEERPPVSMQHEPHGPCGPPHENREQHQEEGGSSSWFSPVVAPPPVAVAPHGFTHIPDDLRDRGNNPPRHEHRRAEIEADVLIG